MKPFYLAMALVATSASSLSAAAVVKEDVVGCRNEADLKRPAAAAHVSSKSSIGIDAGKIKSGACAPLNKGLTVSIDQKKGDLLCVRPYGGLDCFWTPNAAINQSGQSSPSESERNFGFKPMMNDGMPGIATSF